MTQTRDYAREDAWLSWLFAVAVGIALNLHYLCTLVTGALVSAFIVSFWRHGFRRWATRLFISTAFGSLLLLISIVAQHAAVATIAQNFWANTGFVEAVGIIGLALVMYFGLNFGVLAGIGIIAIHRDHVRTELQATGAFRYVITAWVGIAAAILVVLGLNVFRPVIIRQYFAPIFPLAEISLAVLVAPVVRRRPLLIWLIVACALFWTLFYGWKRSGVKDWDDLPALIGGQVRACPTTQVLAVPPWTMHGYKHPFLLRNEPEVVRFGYEQLGAKDGFSPRFRREASPPVRVGHLCPTIVWTEAFGQSLPSVKQIARAARLDVPAAELKPVVTRQSSTGLVAMFPPRSD